MYIKVSSNLAPDILDVTTLFDIKVIVYSMEEYNGSTDFTFSAKSVEQSIQCKLLFIPQLRPTKQ